MNKLWGILNRIAVTMWVVNQDSEEAESLEDTQKLRAFLRRERIKALLAFPFFGLVATWFYTGGSENWARQIANTNHPLRGGQLILTSLKQFVVALEPFLRVATYYAFFLYLALFMLWGLAYLTRDQNPWMRI